MPTENHDTTADALKFTFRKNLKSLRKAHGLTQVELSRKCAYDRSYIGKIERGEKQPSFEALARLAEFFDVTIEALFRRDEDRSSCIYMLDRPNTIPSNTYDDIMQNVSHVMGILNPQYEIISFNAPALKLNFDSPQDVLGKTLWETDIFVNPDQYRDWVFSHRNQSEQGETIRRRFELLGGDGDTIPVQYSLTPILKKREDRGLDYFISEGHEIPKS